MTTTDASPLHSGAGVDASSNTAQAQRAVKVFRAMQPGLTSFARVLTGRREVRVQLATGGPRTDGTKIMYRPPIALGSGARHDRSACDQRDGGTGLQRCPACAVREEVMIQIYHEIAHIAFGSFQKIEDQDKAELIARALEEYPSRYADKIKERFSELPDSIYKDYMNMSQVISPYLPPLLNALEDVRIDNAMFTARKGTKKMFDAMTTQIFATGMEQDDGSFEQWRDQPVNAQITVGIFCLGSLYDYTGWFSEEVEEALNDATLQQLVADCVQSGTNAELYRKSFPILARIRELGFLRNPEDEEDDDGPGDPSDLDDSSSDSDTDGDSDDSVDEDSPEAESEEEEVDEDDPGPGEASDELDSSEDSTESGDGDSDESTEEDDSETDSSSDDSDSGESESAESEPDSPEEDDPEDGDELEGTSSSDDEDSSPESDEDGPSSAEGSGGSQPEDADGEDELDDSDSDRSGDDPQESGGSGQGAGQPGHDRSDSGVEGGPEDSDKSGDHPEDDEPEQDSHDTDPDEDHGQPTDSEGDEELVDSGADEGKGGAHSETVPQGTPTDVSKSVEVFGHHGEIHDFDSHSSHGSESSDTAEQQSAVDTAIVQGLYFETPSIHIDDVNIFRYGEEIPDDDMFRERFYAWRFSDEDDLQEWEKANLRRNGQMVDIDIPEQILGPATLESRRAFNDNQRAIHERNLRAGKIRNGALGKRAWSGDERLFQRSNIPGKKSYSVLIGIDISMSTIGENIALSKRAAYAQAELCSRLGIDFAIWAHSTGGYSTTGTHGQDLFTMDMYEIKSFDEEWIPDIKHRLESIAPVAGNLDGHSIEFYRKLVEQRPTTDKIVMYYTDGKMPAANHDEELEVLQREIRYCKARGITLMGVGIRTDSPKAHGLDTCEVNTDEDLVGVVRHLSKRLDMTR